MSDKKQAVKIVSPRGIAVYPRLVKPDTKYNPDGVYQTRLSVRLDAATKYMYELELLHAEAVDRVKEELGKKKIKIADLPWTIPEDEDNDDSVIFNYKLKAIVRPKDKTKPHWTQKPVLFDAKGKPITKAISVGSGTVMKVMAEVIPFYTTLVGAGISLRLKAAQIIQLVEYVPGSSASAMGFEEEEGGFNADDYEAPEGFTTEEDNSPGNTNNTNEEEDEEGPNF